MGVDLQKTVAAKSRAPATERKPADGTKARELPDLEEFKKEPLKRAQAILRLRSKEKIGPVLSNADFAAGLAKLASDAAAAPKSAVALSKFVLRPEFSTAAAAAVATAGGWMEPSKFGAEDRRLVADALERLRPSWGLQWLVKALVAASERDSHAALRRFFASRLILASGGLPGAVDAVAGAQSGLKPKGQLSLVRELRDCARPAPRGSKPFAFIAFAQNVSAALGHDGEQLKQEVAQLLCDAAAADRGLLLDEKFIGLVTTLDAAAGATLREDVAKLAEGAPGLKPPRDGEMPPPEKPIPPDQATILREATWSDADEALGRALRDMGALDRSFQRLESVVDGEAADRTRRAKDASNFVLQWVRQAAHQRSIKVLNSAGERVRFDPLYHILHDDAAPGDYVRVVKPSVVRGSGAQQVVLVRGEVEHD
jgi:hypothetical protein